MKQLFSAMLALAILFTCILPACADEIINFSFNMEDYLAAHEGDLAAHPNLDDYFDPEMARDNQNLSNYIAVCRRFGTYGKLAEALLCAACIPYGRTPEQCVAELRLKGFEFEHNIYMTLPDGVSTFDMTAADDGTMQLLMLQEVCLTFSSNVALYLCTEAMPTAFEPMENADSPDASMWELAKTPSGSIVCAHLEFLDERTREWLTWDFTSPENYRDA